MVQDALGGGIELVGAIWLLLVSIATLAPAVAEAATAIFGLGLIVWFLVAGLQLIRR